MQPTQSPLLNNLLATTDPRVSPVTRERCNGKQTDRQMRTTVKPILIMTMMILMIMTLMMMKTVIIIDSNLIM